MIEIIKNERPSQKERVLNKLKQLADYYTRVNVYNTYWFYFNNTEFNKYWRRLDYRKELAKVIRKARKNKLFPKLKDKSFVAGQGV